MLDARKILWSGSRSLILVADRFHEDEIVVRIQVPDPRCWQVPLYEGEELSEPGHSRASNPKYYEFVVAMIDSSLSETTESTILRDILRVVTGMVYVDEPLKPDRTVEDCIEHWHRFLHLEAVVKEVEPRKPMLRWVQDRIDAMGATEAALRLLSNHNKMVQLSAVALLASLLQGTNRRVQRTIRSYTIKHKVCHPSL